MQIKQFQFGTQNETKTSIFYISGKVLALPTPRASPKYPATPLSTLFSFPSFAGQAIAEGKIIILAYLHAALVLAVQLTDSLGWTDYDSASDCCSNSCSDSPTPVPCTLVFAAAAGM